MDPITHALTGLALSVAEKPFTTVAPGATWWASFLGSQVPDADIVARFRGSLPYLKHHRGFTHSVPGVLLGGMAVAAVVRAFFPGEPFIALFAFSVLSEAIHVFLDLLTSYGTRVAWPWSRRRYAYDLLMIVDPVLMILLGLVPLTASLTDRPVLASVLGFGLVSVYLLARLISRQRAERFLRQAVPGKLGNLAVLPGLLGLRTWKFVRDEGDQFVTGCVDTFIGKIAVEAEVPKNSDGLPQLAYNSPSVEVFLDFARFPAATEQRAGDRTVITWEDVRYRYGRHGRFLAHVIIGSNGELIGEGLGPAQP